MPALALHGGAPVRSTPFPPWPHYDERERDLLGEVLDSRQWWATQGTKVAEFERRWGEYHGTGPAVAVTNGSHAIEVALLALGVGAGDEVIVPAWTFVATAASVLMVNAVPVLVDVDLGTGCADPAAVEAAITPRTRAVIAVHLAGHPADLDALRLLCDRHGLALVEDAAHAHGSRWNGRPAGTLGDAGTYSFQASKLMTGGEGGAVVSRRPEVLAAARSFSDCGRRPGEWFYSHYVLGGNFRMTEWQGAVLLAQLERFEAQADHREANARLLDEELAAFPGVEPQRRDPRCDRQGHYCYVVRIDAEAFGAPRDAVREALVAEGIPMTMAYPALHQLDVFRDPAGFEPRLRSREGMQDFASLHLPVAERLAATTLWFTTAVLMGDRDDAMDVVRSLRKVHAAAPTLERSPWIAAIGDPFRCEELPAAEVLAELGPYVVAANDPPWSGAAPHLAPPVRVVPVTSMELAHLEALARQPDGAEVVVGFGGGTALDTAKYLAWRRGLPLYQVPTITSVDAGFTDAVGVRVGGHVRYVGNVRPELVVVDLALVQGAPQHLNRAGVGDILSCHTGLFDWQLAAAAGAGPPWRDDLAALGRALLDRLADGIDDVAAVSADGVRLLADCYRLIGAACAAAGHSRFEEGSEHFFAYHYEHLTGQQHVHGELICLAVCALAVVQGNEPDLARHLVARAQVRAHPDDLHVGADDFRRALLGLAAYSAGEHLDRSVVDLVGVTTEQADEAWSFVCGLARQATR